jgi:hypothetical protein
MNPHLTELQLNDLADGERSASLHTHVVRCEECTRKLEDLRALKTAFSALPRESEPERELFSGIRARISAPKRNYWKPLAFALAAGLAAMALWPKGQVIGFRQDVRGDIKGAEMIYQRALEDLVLEVDEKRANLDPETLATIEENLKLVDEAIKASRLALERDPANRQAAMLVASAYQSKLDMYRLIERTSL